MKNKKTRMSKKSSAQKSFSVLIVYLISLLLMTGCGGGSNPVSTLAEQPITNQPAKVTGSVELDSTLQIDPSTLNVSAAAGEQPVSKDGSFSVDMTSNAVGLATVTKSDGSPLYFSIVPVEASSAKEKASQTSTKISALTTASSLLFLSPGVLITEPSSAKALLAAMESLTETKELASYISQKLAAGLSLTDISGDTQFTEKKTKAFEAFAAFLKGYVAQKEKSKESAGTPPYTVKMEQVNASQNSGLAFDYLTTLDTKKTLDFKATNVIPRYMDLYKSKYVNGLADSSTETFVTTLKPASYKLPGLAEFLVQAGLEGKITLIQGFGETNFQWDTNEYDDVMFSVYGLGKLSSIASSSQKNKIIAPAARTFIFELLLPFVAIVADI